MTGQDGVTAAPYPRPSPATGALQRYDSTREPISAVQINAFRSQLPSVSHSFSPTGFSSSAPLWAINDASSESNSDLSQTADTSVDLGPEDEQPSVPTHLLSGFIKKPPGQPNRPETGGFSFRHELNMTNAQYVRFRVRDCVRINLFSRSQHICSRSLPYMLQLQRI